MPSPMRLAKPHVVLSHRKAMDAKEEVFRAQDALSLAWSAAVNAGADPRGKSTALLRKVEKRLRRVRGELEQLDNEVGWALGRLED